MPLGFALMMNFAFLRFGGNSYTVPGIYCDGDPLGILQQPLFVDYSKFVHVVIVKWNRNSTSLCLLLLCGDVHSNPGPTIVYPCSVCEVDVLDDNKAVCCDSCDQWVHVSCDPSLSDLLYDKMVQNSMEDPWFCSECMNDDSFSSENSTERKGNQLSCICLNARSILPKRFDFLAYVCCHKVDIIAITARDLFRFLILKFVHLPT